MLSDSPPERDVEWTEAGVEGAWRFVQRLWTLVVPGAALPPPGAPVPEGTFSAPAAALRKAVHRTISAVTQDIERFHFNRAVAQCYELATAIRKARPALAQSDAAADLWALSEALSSLVLLVAPMMPHLAEECWQALGGHALVVDQPWPQADAALIDAQTIAIPVQVNGKKRAELRVPKGLDRAQMEQAARAHHNIIAFLAGREIRKVIVVPDRIVNIVV